MENRLLKYVYIGMPLTSAGAALSAWGAHLHNEFLTYAGAAISTIAVAILGYGYFSSRKK